MPFRGCLQSTPRRIWSRSMRLEQRLEVALAEALVALALDDLEEDRADRVGGEDLQQLALLGLRVGVDQDLVPRNRATSSPWSGMRWSITSK
jgi:hypothetical protein